MVLAIIAEITGTLSMKWSSVSDDNVGYIFMLLMITLSYILLSFSVKKIALGVAYAMWEGMFDESNGTHNTCGRYRAD